MATTVLGINSFIRSLPNVEQKIMECWNSCIPNFPTWEAREKLSTIKRDEKVWLGCNYGVKKIVSHCCVSTGNEGEVVRIRGLLVRHLISPLIFINLLIFFWGYFQFFLVILLYYLIRSSRGYIYKTSFWSCVLVRKTFVDGLHKIVLLADISYSVVKEKKKTKKKVTLSCVLP